MQKMRLKMRNLPSRDLQMPVLQQSVLGHRRETSRVVTACPADLAFDSKFLRFLCASNGCKRLQVPTGVG